MKNTFFVYLYRVHEILISICLLTAKYTLFYKNIFYKNIEAEIYEILRIF